MKKTLKIVKLSVRVPTTAAIGTDTTPTGSLAFPTHIISRGI